MRLAIVPLFLLFLFTAVVGQRPEWDRVYTFDDSIIEMNTTLLTAVSEDVTRVRFRWIFEQPQPLNRTSQAKYKSKLEVIEFNCSRNRARSYHVTWLSADGSIVGIDDTPGQWHAYGMLQKLSVPACALVKKKIPNDVEPDEIELERVEKYSYQIGQQLKKTKDFQSIVDHFFVPDYLGNYLQDNNTNWFLYLDRGTAAGATHKDLARFYIALMNSGYVGSLYLLGRTSSDLSEPGSLEEMKKLVTPDVWNLIRHHPYTAAYKNDRFPPEKIDDIQQLRSYTDLLEKTISLMRQHVRRSGVEDSKQYREVSNSWKLYQPKVRVCAQSCLGLPSGTKLFVVNVPVFSLQIAEISGRLRVVSATYLFK